MTDFGTDPQRSAIMRAVKQKHTGPEMIVRKLLFSLGLRYRLHRKSLPGSPDVIFPSRRIAVFVHGCFWHRHAGCKRATTPKSNADFWCGKFERNVERDRDNEKRLEEIGWRVLVIWECDTRDLEKLTRRIAKYFQLD
jgi:DNA mismatch endonuclease (patch repair protein)